MARKYVRGYTIEDIKVGLRVKDHDDDKNYGIIKNIDDIHNVHIYFFDNVTKKRTGAGWYCFDKKCEFEYAGGKIDIINDNGEIQK